MSRQKNNVFTAWQSIADEVIGVLLVDPDAWQKSALTAGIKADDLPPGAWRNAYGTILAMRKMPEYREGELHPALVASESAGNLDPTWLAERVVIAADDPLAFDHFDQHLTKLALYGQAYRGMAIAQDNVRRYREALITGDNPGTITSEMIEALQSSKHNGLPRSDMGTILERIQADMAQQPTRGIECGIPTIDWWLRGLQRGHYIVWVAPYKSRKTSVIVTIIVNLARRGYHVTFVSLDETAEDIGYRIIALLMAQWFYDNNLWAVADDKGNPLNILDPDLIASSQANWQDWHELQRKAYEWAVAEFARFASHIRVYDNSVRKGFGYVADVETCIEFDRLVYGDVDLCVVDHIQKLADYEDDIVTKGRYCTAQLDAIKTRQNVIMWALSQMNERTILDKKAGSQYSVGATGGGAITSNATAVFRSLYKMGERPDPHWLYIQLKHARRVEAPVSAYQYIHPASGWIPPLPPDKMPKVSKPESIPTSSNGHDANAYLDSLEGVDPPDIDLMPF